MRHEESEMQQGCVSWFRYQYPSLARLLFAVPNGGGRNAIEAAIQKAEGVTPGVSDVLLLVARKGYHGLCIEFKRQWFEMSKGDNPKLVLKKTYQEPEQKAWQRLVEEQGYKYAVIRNIGEFIDLINNYL